MRFGILGPLRVGADTDVRAVTAGRDRVVLGMLLAQAGRVVPVERLLDAMWEKGPPATARGQLQSCVSRLRRALPPGVIVTEPAGYRADVDPDDLDAAVFARLTAEARRYAAQDRPEDAAKLFREALDLWRGPALSGIPGRAVQEYAAALDEQRAVAVEDRIDLELGLGRDRELLAELAGLVERHPLRERLRAQYLLALYLAGRQADALAEYRRTRQVLHDELGIEPGPELRELHRQILTGDVPAAHRAVPTGPAATVPVRCLPRTVADFTGRTAEVDRLIRAVRDADPSGPVIQVIDGMPGSGKTTLALHLAKLMADRYPDAQLFIDLHGHSERAPVEPAAALVTLLRQLDVASERIPGDVDERVALWRRELAARRALVVLDNAASTAQITPLLPAGPGSLALVTSRRRLAGLDGVRPESLPVLPEDEAVALLARVAGDRVTAEPAAAAEVVRRCGHLPLALRLAGARLAHRPRWRVADLARRLGDERRALPELAAEDRTVASAFTLSYSHLPPAAQRLFRLLGVHPGERFDSLAVAALADLPYDDAQDLLDELVDWHLVEEPAPGRYRMHDLMREYAAGLAAADTGLDQRAAIGALLDFHVHAAATVARTIEAGMSLTGLPHEAPARPDLVGAVSDDPERLEEERGTLIPLLDAALATGHHRYAWQLARASWRFLFLRGYTDDIVRTHERAQRAAQAIGDDAALAMAINYLASAHFRAAAYPEAVDALQDALRLRRQLGDDRGYALSLTNLGTVLMMLGQTQRAESCFTTALRIWVRLGSSVGVPSAFAGLAQLSTLLGRYDRAMSYHRRLLIFACEQGDDRLRGQALGDLAQVRLRLGQPDVAVRLLEASLRRRRPLGHRFDEAETRNDLGRARRMQGRHPDAVELHRQALRLAREMGDRRGESVVSNDLALTLAAMGEGGTALDLYRRALAIARQIKHPYEEARALDGIAACLRETDPPAARRHWERALAVYRAMGVPECSEVERRLAGLGSTAVPGEARQDGRRDD